MKKDDSYKKNLTLLDSPGKTQQTASDMVTNYNIQYRRFLNFDKTNTNEIKSKSKINNLNNINLNNKNNNYNINKNLNKNSFNQNTLTNLFKSNQELSGSYNAYQTLGTFGNLKTHSVLPTINKTVSGFNNGKNPYLTTSGKTATSGFRGNSNFITTKKTFNFDDMEIVPIDTYKNIVKDTMENYRTESLPMDINEKENELLNNQKFKNDYFNNNNRTLFGKTMNHNITYGENAVTKVDIKDRDFNNPRDAIKILNSNRNIYSNINNSLINITKMYYDRTIFGIEKFHEFTNSMCKVRISSMDPKANKNGTTFKKGEKTSNNSKSER